MMDDIQVWLSDILNAINEIESFLPEERNFFEFKADIRTKRAVERNLEIIGEAVNRIERKKTTIKISEASKIIATRNRIIHGYDSVSDEIIWSIINRDIYKLKQEVEGLLNT